MECFSMMRISMSLPKKLLADFDEVLKERGYQSRSKGIRDASGLHCKTSMDE